MITETDRYEKVKGDDPQQEFSTKVVIKRVKCPVCAGKKLFVDKWDMERPCPRCFGLSYILEKEIAEKTKIELTIERMIQTMERIEQECEKGKEDLEKLIGGNDGKGS